MLRTAAANIASTAFCCVLLTTLASATVAAEMTLSSTVKLWSGAPHNAFTDLTEFNGKLYISFREASRHAVPPEGTDGGNFRIISSANGSTWALTTLISFGVDHDLRDPKLSVTPDNRLMLVGIDQPHDMSQRQSYSWFSTNGTSFGPAMPSVDAGRWLWRATWHDGLAYGISYAAAQTRLHVSGDGVAYSTVVSSLSPGNESSLLFRRDGSAVAIVRRDNDDVARIGTSSGSLTSWVWHDATHFVGGPNLLELPDGRVVVGGRFTNGSTRTALALLDPDTGVMSNFLNLPSGGDTGYPGLLWKDDKLLVSYYSSHEGKASIYFSEVNVNLVPEPATLGIIACTMCTIGLRRLRPATHSISL